MSVPWNELYWCNTCRMYLDDTKVERAGEANMWHDLDNGTTCGPVTRLDSPEESYERGIRAALEAATREAIEIQQGEVAGPKTPAAGAIRVLRAIERLLEEAGKGPGRGGAVGDQIDRDSMIPTAKETIRRATAREIVGQLRFDRENSHGEFCAGIGHCVDYVEREVLGDEAGEGAVEMPRDHNPVNAPTSHFFKEGKAGGYWREEIRREMAREIAKDLRGTHLVYKMEVADWIEKNYGREN